MLNRLTVNRMALAGIVIFLMFFFVFNAMTPLWNDEYSFSFSVSDPSMRITSYRQIVESQIAFYKQYSGRVFIHTFIQLFCWKGKEIFNVLNTLSFVGLACAITLLLKRNSSFSLLFSLSLVWLFAPVPGETFFWLSGAMNYMWTSLAFLFFIYTISIPTLRKLSFALAPIIGMLHENIFIAGMLFLFLSLVHSWIFRSGQLRVYTILLLLFLIGGLFLIFSPGNFNRALTMYSVVDYTDHRRYFYWYLKDFFLNWTPLAGVVLFFLLLAFFQKHSKPKHFSVTDVIRKSDFYLILLLGGGSAPFGMYFSPEAATRTTFISTMLLLVGTTGILCNVIEACKSGLVTALWWLAQTATIVLAFMSFSKELPLFYDIFSQTHNNISAIKKAKENNAYNDIAISGINATYSKYQFVYNLKHDTGYIVNKNMAKYFNVNSIRKEGAFVRIDLAAPVACGYSITYCDSFTNRPLQYSSFIYNNYDGASVYFEYPYNTRPEVGIQFGDKANRTFKIKSIEFNFQDKVKKIVDGQSLWDDLSKEDVPNNQCYYNIGGFIEFTTSDSCKMLKFNFKTLSNISVSSQTN